MATGLRLTLPWARCLRSRCAAAGVRQGRGRVTAVTRQRRRRVMVLAQRVMPWPGPEGGAAGVKRAGVFARLRLSLVLAAVAVVYGTAAYQVV